MSSALTLYTNKLSRGRIVHWMLEELGEPYQVEWVEFGREMKQADYLDINPMGKVPALKHGDAIITETPAILTYLADAFPEKELIPVAGSTARADFYRWLFFTAGPLEQATVATCLDWEAPQLTPMGTPGRGFIGYGNLKLTLNTVENHLNQHTFICGDQFTAADVYLASHLSFGIHYAKAYPTRPVFDRYIKKTHQRPAKQRVDAL